MSHRHHQIGALAFPALALFWILLQQPCAAQNCNTSFVFNQTNYVLSNCVDLSVQGAKLAWTYHSSNNSVDLVFSGTASSSSGWVGWGINPTTPNTMVGSSVFIAFQSSVNGSNVLPYKLTTQIQTFADPCACSPIDFVVNNTAVEISGMYIPNYSPAQTFYRLYFSYMHAYLDTPLYLYRYVHMCC